MGPVILECLAVEGGKARLGRIRGKEAFLRMEDRTAALVEGTQKGTRTRKHASTLGKQEVSSCLRYRRDEWMKL